MFFLKCKNASFGNKQTDVANHDNYMRTRTRNTLIVSQPSIKRTFIRPTSLAGRLDYTSGTYYEGTGVTSLENTQVTSNAYIYFTGTSGVSETISDVVGQQGHFNYCSHSKVTYNCPMTAVSLVGQFRKNGVKLDSSLGTTTCDAVLGVPRSLLDLYKTPPFMATDEQMLAEAASRCNPSRVKPAFDTSLQIGELAEGYRSVIRAAATVKRLQRDTANEARSIKDPRVRRLVLERKFDELSIIDWALLGSGAHLSYTLAVKPLVAACKQLYAAGRGYAQAIGQYVSVDRVLHGVSSRDNSQTYSNVGWSDGHKASLSVNFRKEVRATVKVRYGPNPWLLSALTPTANMALYPNYGKGAFAFDSAYYGLVPTLSTAWALTPFSFVVDWFTGFGNWLAQWTERPVEQIEYTILETGWSRKETVTSEGRIQPLVDDAFVDIGSIQAAPVIRGTRISEDYLREAKSFDPTIFTPSPPKFGLPNVGQAVTLLELIFQLTSESKGLFRSPRR